MQLPFRALTEVFSLIEKMRLFYPAWLGFMETVTMFMALYGFFRRKARMMQGRPPEVGHRRAARQSARGGRLDGGGVPRGEAV